MLKWLNNANCFDTRTFFRCLMVLAFVVFLSKISAGYGLILLTLLAFSAMATNRPERLFFVVMMCVTLTVTSNVLVPKSPVALMVIRGTLALLAFILTLRVAGLRSSRYMAPVLLLIPYVVVSSLTSVMGWSPIISELKILLFSLIMLAFYSSGCLLLHDERIGEPQLRAIMLCIASYIVIGSFVLIPVPAVSIMNLEMIRHYEDLKSLFCGITSHSQCLGPLCAIVGTIVFGDMLMGVRRYNCLHLIILILIPYLVYKTQSRTAMGAMVAGYLVVLFFFIRDRAVTVGWRQKVMSLAVLLGIVGSVMIVSVPHLRKAAVSFINKRTTDSEKSVDLESVIAARGGKAAQCIYYFKQSPIFGNGFQVAPEMARFKAQKFTDYLAAPIEKGFIWAAVLEESGVIGFILFTLFVFGFSVKLIRNQAYIGISTFIVFLLSNSGEFNFFSLTYSGGIMWASVFLGMALDGFRLREGQRRMAALRMQNELFGPGPMMRPSGRPSICY